MAQRPTPKPRPKFKITKKCGQFRLEFPKERDALNRIKTFAERGLISIDFQSAPMLDQRGNVRVYLEYTVKELMTEETLMESRKRELADLQAQLKENVYNGGPQSGPRPMSGVTLTAEEQELLKPIHDDQES